MVFRLLMQDSSSYAKYVYCYAHQLNLVIRNAYSKNIMSVRLFFTNIIGFTTFFFSTKPNDLLQSFCNKCIRTVSRMRWNFRTGFWIVFIKTNVIYLNILRTIKRKMEEWYYYSEESFSFKTICLTIHNCIFSLI